MKKLLCLLVLVFLISIALANAQMTITYPEDGVTYGPWSDTYIDYARTGGKAHEFRMQVTIDDPNVAYYNIVRYGEIVREVSAEGEGDIMNFAADDLEPMTMIGFLSAIQDFEVIAYDVDANELGRDSIEFYIAVALEDYYEVVESEPGFADAFVIREEDFGSVGVTVEQVEVTEDFFSVSKTVTYTTVLNRFTGETEEHTRVRLTVTPLIPGAADFSLDLYAFIPKEVVETLNDMTLEGNYEVIDTDPVMMWNFAAVEEPQTFEFDVHETLEEEAIREISTVAVSDVEVERTNWYFMIPLVLPIAMLFGIVYFNRFKKHH
jgi:hypothetical protein